MNMIIYIGLSVLFSALLFVLLQLCGVLSPSVPGRLRIPTLKKYRLSESEVASNGVPPTEVSESETANEPDTEIQEPLVLEPKPKREKKPTYGSAAQIAIAVLSLCGSFGVFFALNHYVFSDVITMGEALNFAKLSTVLLLVTAAALIDWKKRVVPNLLVVCGLAARAVVLVLEAVFCRDLLKDILINAAIGFGLGFGILFLAGLITHGVGFGDVKLFAVIGLSTGYLCTIGTLFWSLLVSALVGIVLLVRFKDRKMAFPYAPCILIGYVGILLCGIF